MLHLNDQTMPVYQQKVSGEVRDLEQRVQELRRTARKLRPDLQTLRDKDLERLDGRVKDIETRLSQLKDAPQEMRDRMRADLDSSLEDLRRTIDEIYKEPKE